MGTKKSQRAIEIKILLMRKGITQAEICRRAGLKPPTISNVIAGRKKGARVRALIANMLDLRIEQVWSDNNHGQKAA